MPLRLVCLDGHADLALDRAVVVVGRHRRCHVRIASPRVSRRHCRLALDRDGVLVRDLGSTNGTRINGRRAGSGRLRAGDELSIAEFRFRVEAGRAAEVSLSSPRADLPDAAQGATRGSDDAAGTALS